MNRGAKIRFYKYQGTGNDFIVIDDRKEVFNGKDRGNIERLCHRGFGIGADGLILLRDHSQFDFEMLYYNSDGLPGSLCGNGSRCAVHFAHHLGIISDQTKFQTSEGVLEAFISEGIVRIKMPDVDEVTRKKDDLFLNTGSPHHVCFRADDLNKLDVYHQGKEIRYSPEYELEGTNVNFVKAIDKSALFVRTYERGVENETLSCGTGVTAAALAYAMNHDTSNVKIKTLGGDLEISFKKTGPQEFRDIYLIGPASIVFEGTIQH